MNMFKKNGGFTLVELIVVIAILAILAGVAVPVYSGYIAKAEQAADYTQLDAIKTAVFFAVAEEEPEAQIETIEVAVSDAGVVIEATDADDVVYTTGTAATGEVAISVVAYVPSIDLNCTTATWADGEWTLE